jgi:hypothetical protein
MSATESPSPRPNGHAKGPRHNTNAAKPLPDDLDFAVSVKHSSVTHRRIPATHADEYIEKPGVSRGNAAVSTEKPYGADPEYVNKFKDFVRFFFSSSCSTPFLFTVEQHGSYPRRSSNDPSVMRGQKKKKKKEISTITDPSSI